jgi:hypothetical protein
MGLFQKIKTAIIVIIMETKKQLSIGQNIEYIL